MGVDLLRDRGTLLQDQRFTWREMVKTPISKLDDDSLTRVRVLQMSAVESEAIRFGHAMARTSSGVRRAAARLRRVEQHQQTTIRWLLPADETALETTLALEQASIQVTAGVARSEPDPYFARIFRFGLLEELDHLYRFAALMDRVEGKDANDIVQSYTDILPGRPTSVQHRHADDDLRAPYRRDRAELLTRLHALTVLAAEEQARDYYMNVGPTLADPLARQLYAEIASIEEQHVTQIESLIDPEETLLERWLLHEATEVYNYWSCVESESNPRLQAIWERFLDYELGQLRFVADLFENIEKRDAAEVLTDRIDEPIRFEGHRDFVRATLRREAQLRARDDSLVAPGDESPTTRAYRDHVNADGSPSDRVAADWRWSPGTELAGDDARGRLERRPA